MEVYMGLSRKRKKELKQLRLDVSKLARQKKELLNQFGVVSHRARKQAGYFTNEQIIPRVQKGYGNVVRPVTDSAGRIVGFTRQKVVTNVLPAIGSTIGTLLSVADHARAARIAAVHGASSVKNKNLQKSGPGAGTIISITLGVIALAATAYAAWQILRAEEELWVAEEELESLEHPVQPLEPIDPVKEESSPEG